MFDDMTPRYAPDHVIIARVMRLMPVSAALFHPARTHKGSPIRPEMGALELQTAAGSRWYGCQHAYINSELRMVVIGTNSQDEVRAKWEIVPENLR